VLFLLNLRKLRKFLEQHISFWDKTNESVKKRITIKRKKKMIIEETPNGGAKLKRRNVIKIEIIE